MGYIRKALEKGFSEMYGLGGGSGTIVFQKLAREIYMLIQIVTKYGDQNITGTQHVRRGWGARSRRCPRAMFSPLGCLPWHMCSHISQGHLELRQLGGFSGFGAIVPSFLPTECSGGGGMWGIFGKDLKRAIWNTWVCILY